MTDSLPGRYIIKTTDLATAKEYVTDLDALVEKVGREIFAAEAPWATRGFPEDVFGPPPPPEPGAWEAWWTENRRKVRSWLGLPETEDPSLWPEHAGAV